MRAWQKPAQFGYHMPCSAILALSLFTLGVILFWTLEHTDIVAFVTVLLGAIVLEAFLVFSLFKAASLPERSTGDQGTGSRKLAISILANLEKLRLLVGTGTEKYPQ